MIASLVLVNAPKPPQARGRPLTTARLELAAAVGPRTAAVLLLSPVMPTGAVLSAKHLDAIAAPVSRHGAWVIWGAAMERIRRSWLISASSA